MKIFEGIDLYFKYTLEHHWLGAIDHELQSFSDKWIVDPFNMHI
jgi:hypothetical protein